MPGVEAGARHHGIYQRRDHGALRAHAGGGDAGRPSCWRKTACKRGENGLRVIMMCEVPSNALLADEFLEFFDGFSIGSNDLTQLTLGLDRDSGLVAEAFDERDPAVKACSSRGPSPPAAPRASTWASAGRGPRITSTSRCGWWSRASARSRSTRTRWSIPGARLRRCVARTEALALACRPGLAPRDRVLLRALLEQAVLFALPVALLLGGTFFKVALALGQPDAPALLGHA